MTIVVSSRITALRYLTLIMTLIMTLARLSTLNDPYHTPQKPTYPPIEKAPHSRGRTEASARSGRREVAP